MPVPERASARSDLPDELLELAAERLLAVPPGARAQALNDLVRERPADEAPLRRLAGDLAGAERLLDEGFSAPNEPMPAVGPYRVLGTIGEGAFGVVYRCAQDAPVRREVAVKVLRPGAGDRHTLARFEAERHVLARLSHPAIAQVFDAGVLPDGRPWFAMEHVPGLPITTWCDRHCLGVEGRVSLFVRLCQGVHHAHAQGIVHRDLKPANILVFEQDGQPQPKIIDFGIAKALDAPDAPHPSGRHALRTDTGRVVGTPGYMSPEQSAGGSGDLDARADVFSLGVILYELLTGELPWGRRPATTDSEPLRPSARVATDTTGVVARQRATPKHKLASRLRGDLDWIVLQALARQREHRYATTRELAADLVRHLRCEAVLAGPPALGYRLRKLARRHRTALPAAGAVLLTFAIGLWVSLAFRAEAIERTADVEAVAAGLLTRAKDPDLVGAPQSEALRRVLAQDALGFYDKLLSERPAKPRLREGRARALWTLSQVHWLVGEYARAESAARESAAEAEALLAVDPEETRYRAMLGNSLRSVGRALFSAGGVEAAREPFARAVRELDVCEARAPNQYSDLLVWALVEWSSSMPAGDPEARARALERAAAIQEQRMTTRPSIDTKLDYVDVLSALGQLRLTQGDAESAGAAFRHADDLLAETPQARPVYVCKVQQALAKLAGLQGKHTVAIRRLHKAIAAATRWSEQEPAQPQAWRYLSSLQGDLAQEHRTAGNPQAAAQASRAAIVAGEAESKRFPADGVARCLLAYHYSSLAQALLVQGRRGLLAEAEVSSRRAIDILEGVPESVDARLRAQARWLFLHDLGCVLDARGGRGPDDHWEAALQAMNAWREQFGVSAADAGTFTSTALRVASRRLAAGLAERANAALDQVDTLLRAQAPTVAGASLHVAELCRLRALLAARSGQVARAAQECERAASAGGEWQCALAAAEGMHALWRTARDAGTEGRPPATDHRDRAIELHREAMDKLRSALTASPDDPWLVLPLAQAGVRMAMLLTDRGERGAAAEVLDEALPALTALRDEAHADRWDEALWVEGRAMAAR